MNYDESARRRPTTVRDTSRDNSRSSKPSPAQGSGSKFTHLKKYRKKTPKISSSVAHHSVEDVYSSESLAPEEQVHSNNSEMNTLDFNDRAEASEERRSDGSGGKPS